MRRPEPVTAADIDALLPFIEAFERPGFVFAQWASEEGVIRLAGNYDYSPEAQDFQKALCEHNWIAPFDWPRWQDTAVEFVQEPERLNSADAETIRRLFTTHVRMERFCDGHLVAMFDNGHILALLRRLREILEQMEHPCPGVARVIDRFTGDHSFLSNFHPAPITVDSILFPTVEHAFQAAKTFDGDEKRAIAVAPTPAKAKRLGRKVLLRPDWEQVKLDVMEDLVWLKFSAHRELRDMLLDTGDATLIEGNDWNDRFWGVCRDEGRNELGLILMKVRRELADTDDSAGIAPKS